MLLRKFGLAFFFSALLTLILLSTTALAETSYVIEDNSFESDTDIFGAGTGVDLVGISPDYSYEGSKSLKLTSSGAAKTESYKTPYVGPDMDYHEGDTLNVSVKLYVPLELVMSDTKYAEFIIYYTNPSKLEFGRIRVDSTKTQIRYMTESGILSAFETVETYASQPVGRWINMELNNIYIPASTATSKKITLDLVNNKIAGSIYFDCFKVTATRKEPIETTLVYDQESLVPNQTLNITVNYENTTNAAKDIIGVAALYDDSGNLSGNIALAHASVGIDVNSTGTFQLSLGALPNVDLTDYQVKIFIWNGTNFTSSDMQPLSNVKVFPSVTGTEV